MACWFKNEFYEYDGSGTFRPIGSAATDARPAIQAAITAAVAYGPSARVLLDWGGTRTYTKAGTNPYEANTFYGFNVTGPVEIHVAAGTTLRLADGQIVDIAGNTKAHVHGFVFLDADDVRFTGDGTYDHGALNQPGWTGGNTGAGTGQYGQEYSTIINPYSSSVGGVLRFVLDGPTFRNAFGEAFNNGFSGGYAAGKFQNTTIRNVSVYDCGEHVQMIGHDYFTVENLKTYDLRNVARGDAFEPSRCRYGTVTGFRYYGTGQNNLAGSAIDNYGTKNVHYEDTEIVGANDGISTSTTGESITSDALTFRRLLVSNCRAGLSAPDGSLQIEDATFLRVAVGSGSNASQLSTTDPAGRVNITNSRWIGCASVDVQGRGVVRLLGCQILGGTSHGITLSRNASGHVPTLQLHRCDITGNTSNAIAGSSNGTAFSPNLIARRTDLRGNGSASFGYFGNANDTNYDLPTTSTPTPGDVDTD